MHYLFSRVLSRALYMAEQKRQRELLTCKYSQFFPTSGTNRHLDVFIFCLLGFDFPFSKHNTSDCPPI